ncbi:MAG TPA: hypothetical protein DDW65_03255 [Firmicutes bacterium]|jgi:hypothetical protein|nr:hypothetical protein [Bacillota bacterium]
MYIRKLLEMSALILSIINGLALLRQYLRDKPKLQVDPVHPESYQWWFKLPSRDYKGHKTRRYGLLIYLGISNRGLRNVSLESWNLFVITLNNKKHELKPISIPEPKGKLGDNEKIYSVLGQTGLYHNGDTLIESGTSISGMAYYIAEFCGDEILDLKICNNQISGEVQVEGVYGKKAKTKIALHERSLEFIESLIPGIEKIG